MILGLRHVTGALVAVAAFLSAPAAQGLPFELHLPVGFPTPKIPEDNPLTVEKVALGRFLFYDTRLSGNQTQACATCHQPDKAFTDGLPQAIGSTGEVHPRGSMTLANVGYASALAWANSLLTTIEKQTPVPMFGEHPVELGLAGREDELYARLRDDDRYQRLFAEAFPADNDPVNLGNIVRAITTFERTLISGDAPYDRYVQGLDDNAISESAFFGGRLFFSERLECFHCHGGFNFTASVTYEGNPFDETSFQNNGLYNIDGKGAYPPNNPGLFAITNVPEDMGRFKAPTLRNIVQTAPYMHDGSLATLDDVIDHYAAGGRTIHEGPYAGDGSKNPFKSNFVRGFSLTAEERQSVLDFLTALSDPGFLNDQRHGNPFDVWQCVGDCGYDGSVTVDELISSINVALGTSPLGACLTADRGADGEVTMDELLTAVNAALNGCVAGVATHANR